MLSLQKLTTGYLSGTATSATTRDLDIGLSQGNLLLLAGRNGSGKSSLLRTIAGLQPSIAGKILYNGKDQSGLTNAERAAEVSIMFSTPPSLEMMTVSEVVQTGMHRFLSPFFNNPRVVNDKIRGALDKAGAGQLLGRYFDSLSDGEKQKIMLARSLAQETPILLLDEPLAFLDYPSRLHMLSQLKEIAQRTQKCILFSSHDLDISLKIADQVLLLLEDGKWEFIEDRNEVKTLKPERIFGTSAL